MASLGSLCMLLRDGPQPMPQSTMKHHHLIHEDKSLKNLLETVENDDSCLERIEAFQKWLNACGVDYILTDIGQVALQEIYDVICRVGDDDRFVSHLVNTGLDVNISRGKGSGTPIRLATKLGRPEIVKVLLHAGAGANATTLFTALHRFASREKDEDQIALAMIQANWDVNKYKLRINECWCLSFMELALTLGALRVCRALDESGCDRRVMRRWYNREVDLRRLGFSPGYYVRRMIRFWYSPQTDQERTYVLNFVRETVRNPLTLQGSCRITIRRTTGTRLLHVVPKLPLPEPLKDFIVMKEFGRL